MLSTDGVCFALDDDGQLIVPLRRISGVPAVRQGIHCRLRMFKKEWFLDLDQGVPWIEDENRPNDDHILGAQFNIEKARFHIRRAILSTPATSPESLSINMEYDGTTRALSIEYNVTAVFDDVPQGLPISDAFTLEF